MSPGPRSRFPFATYDIETKGVGSTEFVLVGFFDGTEYRCFRDLALFFDHVLRPKYAGWRIFAHYGGKFDVNHLFDYLRSRMPDTAFEFYCSGSVVISFRIRIGECEWTFSDSGRILPAGLKVLAKEFGVEHQKLAFAPTDELYNKHDCLGLYEVLTRFFDEHGICSETNASHAMKVYRTFHMPRELAIPHADVEEFVRSCYFGGRCEVFRWDAAEVHLFDVNSMYPTVMSSPMPVEYLCRSTELPDDDECEIGFYEAEVDYPDIYVPCLPKVIDKLYFPSGPMTVFATSMELRQAIIDGAAVRIRRGCLFKAERIFGEYVERIYAMKREADAAGDGAKRMISKLLLNSLYGKFGQRRRQRSYCLDPGTVYLKGDVPGDGPRLYPLENSPGIAWYWTDSMSRHILPHISATVTALSRLKLTGILRASGRIWYTDTDSVFTTSELATGAELGQLSHKGSGRLQVYGCKEYKFGEEIALKGVPLTVTDPATGEKRTDYTLAERYLRGETIVFRRLAGMLESIRIGEPANRYKTVRRVKRPTREKRARQGDDTRPWTVEELTGSPPRHKSIIRPAPHRSILDAIAELGHVDPERIRAVYGSEWWDCLPRSVYTAVCRRDSTNGPDALAGELARMGYPVSDARSLLAHLCGPEFCPRTRRKPEAVAQASGPPDRPVAPQERETAPILADTLADFWAGLGDDDDD